MPDTLPAACEIEALLKALTDPRAATAAASGRALKRLWEVHPAALSSFRKPLLRIALRNPELRVRWNLLVILGRLPLQGKERAAFIDWAFERLGDESSLTRTFALQALTDVSVGDPSLRARIVPLLGQAATEGTPAMRARARKLLRVTASSRQDDAPQGSPHD